MHNRSIRKNKFNPPSMRQFWKDLGGYDALVEYNECAIRQFILKWELACDEGQKYADFIKCQSKEVSINLGYINIEQYRQEIYRWYLIHPYGCFENFIKDLKDDLKSFGYDIKLDSTDKKSALERLILGLKDVGVSISVDKFKFALEKYYHRFRNILAHKLDEKKSEKEIDGLFNAIPKEDVFAFYPSLTDALSAPGVLTFDDYSLCTANLKNIADTLVTDVYLKIDWNNFQIEQSECMKASRRFAGTPERLSNYLRQYISSRYGIKISEATLEILNNRLVQSNNG